MSDTPNSFDAKATLSVGDAKYDIFRLDALQSKFDIARLPFSLKILLENLLRNEDGESIRAQDIEALATWDAKDEPSKEIAFTPARVVMQDFTGVPAVVDLAAMRDAMKEMGGDPNKINPLVPAELVIDHSVQVDAYGSPQAFQRNAELEFERNQERYAFLRWGQGAFHNFKVVPPDTGIVHQVNLEYLARVVFVDEERNLAYPDTLVGTDSHTTMINGLGVLGWGVGGIEAEAAMLGQPMSMLIPQVLGFRLTGELHEGATATDLVLTVTEMLRERGVVGKFVEFYGAGLAGLPLADRATIGNMSPEFGSTCAIFPIDAETLRYLEFSGRPKEQIALVEAYAKEQGLWHDEDSEEPTFSDHIELDLADVVPSIAGPKRPQDRVSLTESRDAFRMALEDLVGDDEARTSEDESLAELVPGLRSGLHPCPQRRGPRPGRRDRRGAGRRPQAGPHAGHARGRHRDRARPRPRRDRGDHQLHQHVQPVGDARRRDPGAQRRPEGPEGQAVGQDLAGPGLQGGHRVPASAPAWTSTWTSWASTSSATAAPPASATAARCPRRSPTSSGAEDLAVVSVLSGNRNFEGRINPDVKMNYLASPPLCVAYALAGTMDIDLYDEPLGEDRNGDPVYLKDIWPDSQEVGETIEEAVQSDMFRKSYGEVFDGDERWNTLEVPTGDALRLGRALHLRAPAAVLRGHAARARAARGHRRRARAGDARRQRHHRPHLAGRLDQARRPRRRLPQRATTWSRATSTPTGRAAATTR